jgi:hypothetical protein
MVTSSVGMLHGVHGNSSHLGPAVALCLELVVSAAGLEEGLVNTTTSSDDSDGGSVGGGKNLLVAWGELHTGGVVVRVVGDDGGVVARGTSKGSAVAILVLNVADDGTFGEVSNGENVADSELGWTNKWMANIDDEPFFPT